MLALAIVLAVLLLLALLPLGVKGEYGEDGLFLFAKAGIISIKLFPLPKREPKKKKEKKPKKPKTEAQPEQKKGGSLEMLKQILPPAMSAAQRFFKGLVINELLVYYTAAGDDAAKTALVYGYGWAAIGAITGALENIFTVKKRDLQVFADFDQGAEPRVYILATATIRLWRLITLGVLFAIAFLKILKQNKKSKQNEKAVQ